MKFESILLLTTVTESNTKLLPFNVINGARFPIRFCMKLEFMKLKYDWSETSKSEYASVSSESNKQCSKITPDPMILNLRPPMIFVGNSSLESRAEEKNWVLTNLAEK